MNVDNAFLDDLVKKYGMSTEQRLKRSGTDEEEIFDVASFRKMIQERILCPIEKGRRFIAVSLAEAETLRRILHGRGSDALIKNQTTQIALRCVPAGGCVFDHSSKWYVVYLSLFSHLLTHNNITTRMLRNTINLHLNTGTHQVQNARVSRNIK